MYTRAFCIRVELTKRISCLGVKKKINIDTKCAREVIRFSLQYRTLMKVALVQFSFKMHLNDF